MYEIDGRCFIERSENLEKVYITFLAKNPVVDRCILWIWKPYISKFCYDCLYGFPANVTALIIQLHGLPLQKIAVLYIAIPFS